MTLVSINTYLLNDDSIHVINKDLENNEYKQLIKHLEVLDDLPVYINDVEYNISNEINVKMDNNVKNISINDYSFEINI
jgi:hypothetical protein